jgi:SNF2 family DNA or RNA helicase
MSHQREALKRAWKRTEYALFHDMGTGKTFTAINLASARFLKDQIQALVVLCPTPIKNVWVEEFESWCPVDYEIAVVNSGAAGKKDAIRLMAKTINGMKVLVAGIEALSQGTAADFVREFAGCHRTMVVADESSKLKNPQSARTKRAVEIARASLFRMIMTGTPITQGIEDLFAQFQFLNPKILRCRSYYVFRNRYCIMGGFENRSIIGYRDSQDLLTKVAPYVHVVKKEDVLDLPDKVYTVRYVEPTKQQTEHIDSLLESFMSEQGQDVIEAETILERLTRLQQIIGGNFPYEDAVTINPRTNKPERQYKTKPVEGKNPKMDETLDILAEIDSKTQVIIWCRFQPEIQQMKERLAAMYGAESVAEFSGMNVKTRDTEAAQFQSGERRFMVSNQAVGGMGQTWTAATLVIYYSNSFSYQDRKQSEDRAHRKGQTNKVTYVDLVMNNKYDRMITDAIRKKGDVAEYVDENLIARDELAGRESK